MNSTWAMSHCYRRWYSILTLLAVLTELLNPFEYFAFNDLIAGSPVFSIFGHVLE